MVGRFENSSLIYKKILEDPSKEYDVLELRKWKDENLEVKLLECPSKEND